MAGLPNNPHARHSLLMQSLLENQAKKRENTEVQNKNQKLMTLLVNNSRKQVEKNISTGPRKGKKTSLVVWIIEVKMWDDS